MVLQKASAIAYLLAGFPFPIEQEKTKSPFITEVTSEVFSKFYFLSVTELWYELISIRAGQDLRGSS